MSNVLKNSVNNFLITNLWNPLGFRIFSFTGRVGVNALLASNPILIEDILTKKSKHLEHESGFFRIGKEPLDKDLVKAGGVQVRNIFNKVEVSESKISEALNNFSEIPLKTRGMGQWVAFSLLRQGILSGGRPEGVEKFLDAYVKESLIPDDVKRRSYNKYRNIPKLRKSLAKDIEEIERVKDLSEAKDLLDVAIFLTNTSLEAAEIYQRLVLASLGFIGVTIEYIFISLSSVTPSSIAHQESCNYAKEVMRVNSPVWRLTRTAKNGFSSPPLNVESGDGIIINVSAANKDEKFWKNAKDFDPGRWAEGGSVLRDLSFGRGERTCPVKNKSLDTLATLVSVCAREYDVSFHKTILPIRRFGTFIAPPRGTLVITKKSEKMGAYREKFATRSFII